MGRSDVGEASQAEGCPKGSCGFPDMHVSAIFGDSADLWPWAPTRGHLHQAHCLPQLSSFGKTNLIKGLQPLPYLATWAQEEYSLLVLNTSGTVLLLHSTFDRACSDGAGLQSSGLGDFQQSESSRGKVQPANRHLSVRLSSSHTG